MINSDTIRLKTTFPLDSSMRISVKNMKSHEGKNTIADIGRGINIMAWNNQTTMIMRRTLPRYLNSIAFTKLCNEIIETLILEDENGNELQLQECGFDYERYDEISYIYGEIEGEPFVTPKDTYIRCRYISKNGQEKAASFCVSNASYEKIYKSSEVFSSKTILFGLVVRKKIEPYQKMTYDKISHMAYKIDTPGKAKTINKLIQFSILNCTERGIYCINPAEKACLEQLVQKGELFTRQTKQNKEYGFVPTAVIYRRDGMYIADELSQYNKSEREKRKQALKKLNGKGICYQNGKEEET